ncbi:unnamed protein product [Lathyrus oleraceus]
MTEVRCSHDALVRPYDPLSFQQPPFPAPDYLYGKLTTPRVSYHQPRTVPHANKRSRGQGYQNQHLNQHRPRSNLERRNALLDPIPMSYNQLLP